MAQNALGRSGFIWLQDFSSIDLAHDVGGLEVCGITEEDRAHKILVVLQNLFPKWKYGGVVLQDFDPRDSGWQAHIQEFPDSPLAF